MTHFTSSKGNDIDCGMTYELYFRGSHCIIKRATVSWSENQWLWIVLFATFIKYLSNFLHLCPSHCQVAIVMEYIRMSIRHLTFVSDPGLWLSMGSIRKLTNTLKQHHILPCFVWVASEQHFFLGYILELVDVGVVGKPGVSWNWGEWDRKCHRKCPRCSEGFGSLGRCFRWVRKLWKVFQKGSEA